MTAKPTTYAKPFLPSERDAEKRLRQDLQSVESYLFQAEAHAARIRSTRDALLNDLAIMTGGKRSKA